MKRGRAAMVPLAAFATMGLFWGAWAALLPDVKERIGASDAEFGAALLWVGVGAPPAMLAAGRLARRLGSRLLSPTLLGFGLAVLPAGFAGSFVSLAVAMVVVGAASGALDVAMNAEVSDLEAADGERLMFGAHALFSLGLVGASVVTGILRDSGVGPEGVLPGITALSLVVAAVSLGAPRPTAQPASGVSSDQAGPGSMGGLRRWALVLGVLCAGSFLIEDALQSWSALHLERTLGATPAVGALGPGAFGAAMFVGRSLGQLIERWVSDRVLLGLAGGVAALGLLGAAVAPSVPIAIASFALAGAAISLVAPTLFSLAGRRAGPGGRASAISTVTFIGYLGFLVGPGAFGVVAGATSLPGAFAVLAAVAIVLGLCGMLILGRQEAGLRRAGAPLRCGS
ncbi:MAG: MFS transporter [Candidatus Limnocylindrales bacterium]